MAMGALVTCKRALLRVYKILCKGIGFRFGVEYLVLRFYKILCSGIGFKFGVEYLALGFGLLCRFYTSACCFRRVAPRHRKSEACSASPQWV